MNLKAQRAAAIKAAQTIVDAAKADGNRPLTADETAEVEGKLAEARELKAKIDAAEKSRGLVDELAGLALDEDDDGEVDDAAGPASKSGRTGGGSGRGGKGGGEDVTLHTFGERFVKSAAFSGWKADNPGGVGRGTPISIGRVKVGTMGEYFGAKALTFDQARTQPTRYPTMDMVERDRLTFLDLISKGQTDGDFDYVQIIDVTRNAAIVPEATSGTDNAALKPISDLTTAIADAKVYTYADGYDVTNKLLRNAPAFASYMDQELAYSLDDVIEDKLLNGTGLSGEPTGLFNLTGTLSREYALGASLLDQIKAIRRAIADVVRRPGGTVQAIVLNPEDDAEIDLLQDNQQRFYGQGPFGSGPGTLWGRPRVTSERVPAGTFVLGDFRQIALLDQEGLSVLAFNQHKDYAQRNMVYVRAELSAAQVFWRPARLCIVGEAAV